MIIVKNRELLIPGPERYIGTTYDTDSENRQFLLSRFAQNGVDLSALTFRLDLKYANDATDTVVLDKEVTDTNIILTWDIGSSVLQVPGTLFIQLRAVDDEVTVKWSSFHAALYVERHLNTPGNYTGSLTEIEQMEQDHQYMKGVVNELKANLDYAHDAEAWAVGKRSGTDVPSTDEAYHNNSKYYKELSDGHRQTSERFAKGSVNGSDVSSGDGYHDNSKYYKELADDHRKTAEAYAKGTVNGTAVTSGQTGYQDNAKYYKEQVQSRLNQIDTNTSNIAVQTARIDNIASLTDGSTTGDAELADIRVGADGVTYISAGAAVRANDSALKSHIHAENIGLIGKPDLLYGVNWTVGSYINGNGAVASNSSFKLSDNIAVTPSAGYTFVHKVISGAIARVTAFDSNGNYISNLSHTDYENFNDVQSEYFVMPSNAASVRLSAHKNVYELAFTSGKAVIDAINVLSQDVSNHGAQIKNSKKTLLQTPTPISFNTQAQTVTLPKPVYILVNNVRYVFESADKIIDYSSVSGAHVTIVVNNSGELSAKGYSAVASDDTILFTFNKSTLSDTSTNNIFYPYYVNGVLYNGSANEKSKVYVDGVNGSDNNAGTASSPFATIQHGIDFGADRVLVARGTYNETIAISNRSGLEIIPSSTPTFAVPNFDAPMIVVNRVTVQNSDHLHFRDIHANNPGDNNSSWHINRATDVTFEHCFASNGQAGGFVTINLYGKFIMCEAWDIGDASHTNSDGFNLHGYGVTEFIDCVAHDCYDDGISHHDGCIASIKGGEYWNCTHGGGIAPVNRYCEIDGVYVHDCWMGLESMQRDATLYDPYILVKNSVFKDSTNYDIRCGDIPLKVIRCTFDTKSIGSNADYVEIS